MSFYDSWTILRLTFLHFDPSNRVKLVAYKHMSDKMEFLLSTLSAFYYGIIAHVSYGRDIACSFY